MRKGFALPFAVLVLALVGCSGPSARLQRATQGKDGNISREAPLSPEADPKAPGMIPAECETLLNRIREWNVQPGDGQWKPESAEIAREAGRFFANFHLVPESTSLFVRAWLAESVPGTEAQAEVSLARLNRAQSCDLMLSHRLLLSLLDYRWAEQDQEGVRSQFLRFVLNQQARSLPSLARAIQLDVLIKAVVKGYIRSDAKALKKMQKRFSQETAKSMTKMENTSSSLKKWQLAREELELSEEIRVGLSALLPLP